MAAATDVGRVRERNEDAVRLIPEIGVAILSDGMGGHNAGDVASKLAVQIIGAELLDPGREPRALTGQALVDSMQSANETILAVSKSEPECHGMGATVVIAAFVGDQLLATHLGDSRLYRYWNGELQQLTEDHTLAQQYVRQGVLSAAEAQTWVGRNMLLRALGIERVVNPAITQTTLAPGQLYLICSDGLTDAVADVDIAEILRDRGGSLQDTADRLVDLANEHGGPDNTSVILAALYDPGGRD